MATGLENLKIYQMAEDLEIEVHNLTNTFPKDEQYRSVDQIKRSSAAVANNPSEGYARHTFKEKIRYLYIAKGEAEETKRNVLKSAKKGFLPENTALLIAEKYTCLLKAISGYISFVRKMDV